MPRLNTSPISGTLELLPWQTNALNAMAAIIFFVARDNTRHRRSDWYDKIILADVRIFEQRRLGIKKKGGK